MNMKQLIEAVGNQHPGLIGKTVPHEAAVSLLRAAFKTIREHVKTAPAGPVKIAGFGVMQVKDIERGEGAQRKTRRRVLLRLGKGGKKEKGKG